MDWIEKNIKNLNFQLIVAIILGLIVGLIFPAFSKAIMPLGTIFLNMLKMIMVPLVFISILNGICRIRKGKIFEKNLIKIVLYFIITSVIAIILGIIIGCIFNIGKNIENSFLEAEITEEYKYSIVDNIVSWFPTNIFEAFKNADIPQILIISLLVGFAINKQGEKGKKIYNVIEYCYDIIINIVNIIMKFAPIGTFALIANMVLTLNKSFIVTLALYIFADIIGCSIIIFIEYSIMLKVIANVSPKYFFKKVWKIIVVAVTTTSSVATLPISLKCLKDDMKVEDEFASFALSLGNAINKDGMAFPLGLISIFAANLYGVPITIGYILNVIFVSLLLSMSTASVKGAGIVISSNMLQSLGFSLGLVPVLTTIWPVIDPGHTTANCIGDICCIKIVSERERNIVGESSKK